MSVTTKKGDKIYFRENFNRGKVEVYINRAVYFAFDEYRSAVKTTQSTFQLSDEQMMEIYSDYKEDYDSQ